MKKYVVSMCSRMLICAIFLWLVPVGALEPWTWSFKKVLDTEAASNYKNKQEMLFVREGVPSFNQLVFSWNAHKPLKGCLTFYASVRDAITKRWYPWHKMIEWGEGKQLSRFSTCEYGTKYLHVRLELPKGIQADAFRVKIKPDRHAHLNVVRALYVTVSNYTKFSNEFADKALLRLPYVHIRGVPKQSQMALNHPDSKQLCSPTSLSMLLGYLGKRKVDPLNIAAKVYDHGLKAYGSWPFNTIHAFEQCGGNIFFQVTRLQSFMHLHKLLTLGMPVIVSIRGPIPTGALDYRGGHLIVVVGWNPKKQVVLCHDPAFDHDDLVYHEYDIRDFMKAWERSHRLAYVAEHRWQK